MRNELLGCCAAWLLLTAAGGAVASNAEPLVLVVMDPLAKELACACIQGYAQRDYGRLSQLLQKRLQQPVLIDFSDNLGDSLEKFRTNHDLVVIGKDSVIRTRAGEAGFRCRPVARLTGMDGGTTLTGLFVVKAADPATGFKDLAGRRIFFGLADAEEKHGAALAALRSAGVTPPSKIETREGCSDAALDLLEATGTPATAAVISSYALALLEGCGSVKKGDLKVIGKTDPVPFVTVFLADSMPAGKQQEVLEVLWSVKTDPVVLKGMESLKGFQPMESPGTAGAGKVVGKEWPDWRGPGRDGAVSWLPDRLPAAVKWVWKKGAVPGGLAGLTASEGRVFVAERDLPNEHDVLRCLDAATGEGVWRFEYRVLGKLDYGEAPRAAPVVREGRVYLLGAFGDLHCLNAKDGTVLWQRHLVKDFRSKLPTWGTCPTPLVVDGKVVVSPGAPQAAVAALDAATGKTLWQTAGQPSAYAGWVAAELGGRRQIVGYDQPSLGGWDPATGERLWRVVPPNEGDFNVPTPLVLEGGRVLVCTENNGARLYGPDAIGRIHPEPLGHCADLAPDTSSPVAVGNRVFGVHNGLFCLDAQQNLKTIWKLDDEAFTEHASLFAGADKVLVVSLRGELILMDARADTGRILSRLRVFADDVEVYSYPALDGTRLYIRGGSAVGCVELGGD